MTQLNSEPRIAQFSSDAFGPFDETDSSRPDVGREEIRILRVQAFEAVEVEVRDEQPACRVAVAERERRARDRNLGSERACGAADQRRLAGTELAGQEDDVAVAKLTRQRRSDGLGRLRGARAEYARRGAQNNPSCSVGSPASAGASTGAGSTVAIGGCGGAGGSARTAGRREKSARSVSSVLGV